MHRPPTAQTSPPRARLALGGLTLVLLAASFAGCGGDSSDDRAAAGARVSQQRGCVACHSTSGGAGVGPTWKGLYGQPVGLDDGATVTADDAYLARSIREPQAQRVAGFAATMPELGLDDAEVDAVIAYIRSLG